MLKVHGDISAKIFDVYISFLGYVEKNVAIIEIRR